MISTGSKKLMTRLRSPLKTNNGDGLQVHSTASWMWKDWENLRITRSFSTNTTSSIVLFDSCWKLLLTDLKSLEMLTSSKQIEPHDEFEWNCKLRWNVERCERSIYLTPLRLKFHHGSWKKPFQWTFSKFLITQYRDTNIFRPFSPVWHKW